MQKSQTFSRLLFCLLPQTLPNRAHAYLFVLSSTRGNMADGQRNTETITENSHNLTITEDRDFAADISQDQEQEVKEPTYKYGYSLPEYYKLCLQYYHKGKNGNASNSFARLVPLTDLLLYFLFKWNGNR